MCALTNAFISTKNILFYRVNISPSAVTEESNIYADVGQYLVPLQAAKK